MVDKSIIEELVANISSADIPRAEDTFELPDNLDETLRYFLSEYNGGYSKDNYFHFFGVNGPAPHNIGIWNLKDTWKRFYYHDLDNFLFFAEDIFGNQFGVQLNNPNAGIFQFWVDDGRLELFANDFEEFLNYTVFGFEVFRQMRDLSESFFHVTSQSFTPFRQLSYKKPLLLGGDAGDVNNLETCDSITNLRLLGQIVTQCHALGKGAKIKSVQVDRDSQTITLVPES